MTTEEENIEELSKEVATLRELKAITFHLDNEYKKHIIPTLDKLPAEIKSKAVDTFNHYFRTARNMVTYLWKEHSENKLILEILLEDEAVKKKIEKIKSEIDVEEESP